MTGREPEVWFAQRTDGAPAALRARARRYFAAEQHDDLGERLAAAGQRALGAAVRTGAGRAAALDLLAADALITLALLAHAERDPATLGTRAVALRAQVSAAS